MKNLSRQPGLDGAENSRFQPRPAISGPFRVARPIARRRQRVPRLIHDRYVAHDDIHGCDLTTGEDVRLDEAPAFADRCDEGPASLIEILNDARDGDPRWIVMDAGNAAQAAVMSARAAADARRRGFVPLLVPRYLRWRETLRSQY